MKTFKNKIKRILIVFLASFLIIESVCLSYITTCNIYAAEATATLTAKMMYEICAYLGMQVASRKGYALEEINLYYMGEDMKSSVAKFGHMLLKTAFSLDHNPFTNTEDANKLLNLYFFANNTWTYGIVVGSSALQEIAETEFSVIQGGKNDNDNDDDKIEKIKAVISTSLIALMAIFDNALSQDIVNNSDFSNEENLVCSGDVVKNYSIAGTTRKVDGYGVAIPYYNITSNGAISDNYDSYYRVRLIGYQTSETNVSFWIYYKKTSDTGLFR